MTKKNDLLQRERGGAALFHSLFAVLLGLILIFPASFQAQPTDEPLRIIAFGAHPDDCEINAAGVFAKWAAAGHKVKCVSLANGDAGHFKMSGEALANRRAEEVKACAEILGIETIVLDNSDGELMPTLENRKTVVRLIREWQADIVMVHRRYDYMSDHRYSGVLIDDALTLVEAKFYTSDTSPLERSPVVLYYYDGFERPYPFTPDIIIGIDDVADTKWDCLRQMPSQFADADSWSWGRRTNIPEDLEKRMKIRLNELKERNVTQANQYRHLLISLYGEKQGNKFRYAEAFQLSQYGRQVTLEELKKLFPVLFK